MAGAKRARPDLSSPSASSLLPAPQQQQQQQQEAQPPAKRRRITDPPSPTTTTTTNPTQPSPPQPAHDHDHDRARPRDRLSRLSDELLLRILSFLPLPRLLLAVAPVSRRFYHLASDSQLWKALYYARFVLPRAMRIPGFREAAAGAGAGGGAGSGGGGIGGGGGGGWAGHKLHYSGRRTLWADGRRGGVVVSGGGGGERKERGMGMGMGMETGGEGPRTRQEEVEVVPPRVDWKRQYKIRYNWARGKCAVEELKIGGEVEEDDELGRKMLVKVVEGVAVTADKDEGLRAWDLKTRGLIAQIDIQSSGADAVPSCIAVDETEFERGLLDVAVGFDDGSFGVWRLSTGERRLEQRYRHEKSSNGELKAMAFSYPYVLTATQAVLVSLYTFEVPAATEHGQEPKEPAASVGLAGTGKLPSPYLLTSLDSYTSRPPLALSIRKAGKATVASVAYTFSTRRGWSIGVQDLHIRQPGTGVKSVPEITTTRIAYTTPIELGGSPLTPPTTPRHPRRRGAVPVPEPSDGSRPPESEPGPTTLCYTHPYLLATLPDNTLVLHMCTSNASSLSISDGIRLWGHTSGISDAEITARGKAVSVSTRGEEMRVWELEGRSAGVGSRSVEIRPWQSPGGEDSSGGGLVDRRDGLHLNDPARDWDERRNWVGFDDEMVIVLKERRGARQSLMVYDFT